MSHEIAIAVDGISKAYRIGARAERYETLVGATLALVRAPLRNLRRLRALTRFGPDDGTDVVWALRDVSFDVPRGEVLGIIGRNGAGKSTLLKVLSRITAPTRGRATIYGRVASLLEVGTGFHPELTGRENIFLNGAVMGMTRHETARKMDAIVDFAGVTTFIDTPVKRYSSGMYVRLAFAVAAHLDPEILIVDEVLSVGDAEFQKQCLGKMDEVARAGRTVLFVSHNVGAVTRLCTSGILLDGGRVVARGNTGDVVSRYLASGSTDGSQFTPDPAERPGDERFRLRAVRVLDSLGQAMSNVDVRAPITVEIEYELLRSLRGLRVGFRLLSGDGTVVFSTTDLDEGKPRDSERILGEVSVSRCTIPGGLLNQGRYFIALRIDVPMIELVLFLDSIVSFFVEPAGGVVGAIPDNRLGVVRPLLHWQIAAAQERRATNVANASAG